MRTITTEQLAEILRLHGRHSRGETGGVLADLRWANLSGAYLSGANLRGAYLSGADLSGADMSGANLREADLREADLSGADMSGANLREANLREANLREANLSGANLRGADLSYANLSGANLSGANLRGANLREADLRGAMEGAVARLDFGGWSVCVRSTQTTIGCQRRDNSDWLSWSSESPEIAAMHADAPEWWRVHGEAVKACIRCVMAKALESTTKGE